MFVVKLIVCGWLINEILYGLLIHEYCFTIPEQRLGDYNVFISITLSGSCILVVFPQQSCTVILFLKIDILSLQ